ncbi:HEPN AbiU2-like domain-containing protein [Vibrio crassostreae]|nr:HEPN AbiU2-like domain-containing protein [Vibrio crassostreae]CAK1759100.1 HEPN AbiU2-like domain-containing protein [Vibrio crassostreae]CAK1759925.1 HEPN AbiU2-like domain-containing protein [Vibrio crassostreae]CAK1760087.1 HEPN AbiU2-like domain-containing protein [Vibrio crassostreae]CAK1760760.1 HEPN AbiU2-like domain-containing protein [Vibrio crassostreae]
MSYPHLSEQSFVQLISDAIHFYKMSIETDDPYESQRFSRSSILYSTLSLESAANCCLYSLQSSRNFINDLEKTTAFAKLDLFAQISENKHIDRSRVEFQRVSELKKVRDSFVHPKKVKIPLEFSVNDMEGDFRELGLHFEANPMKGTGIDRSSMFWFSSDAKSALSAVFSFFEYYFVTLLNHDSKTVMALLSDAVHINEENAFLFHNKALEKDLMFLKQQKIKQTFLNLGEYKQLNVIAP